MRVRALRGGRPWQRIDSTCSVSELSRVSRSSARRFSSFFVLVLPQTSRAQSKDRVGVVERLQGDVSIVHSGNSAKATEGMAISLKDQLVTGADARLQIMLADDTQITLGSCSPPGGYRSSPTSGSR